MTDFTDFQPLAVLGFLLSRSLTHAKIPNRGSILSAALSNTLHLASLIPFAEIEANDETPPYEWGTAELRTVPLNLPI
jgi:hypothetical protein